jgi:hypothetical protein
VATCHGCNRPRPSPPTPDDASVTQPAPTPSTPPGPTRPSIGLSRPAPHGRRSKITDATTHRRLRLISSGVGRRRHPGDPLCQDHVQGALPSVARRISPAWRGDGWAFFVAVPAATLSGRLTVGPERIEAVADVDVEDGAEPLSTGSSSRHPPSGTKHFPSANCALRTVGPSSASYRFEG